MLFDNLRIKIMAKKAISRSVVATVVTMINELVSLGTSYYGALKTNAPIIVQAFWDWVATQADDADKTRTAWLASIGFTGITRENRSESEVWNRVNQCFRLAQADLKTAVRAMDASAMTAGQLALADSKDKAPTHKTPDKAPIKADKKADKITSDTPVNERNEMIEYLTPVIKLMKACGIEYAEAERHAKHTYTDKLRLSIFLSLYREID